jgi:hypothetical protein
LLQAVSLLFRNRARCDVAYGWIGLCGRGLAKTAVKSEIQMPVFEEFFVQKKHNSNHEVQPVGFLVKIAPKGQ